jgi:hypothetical protein
MVLGLKLNFYFFSLTHLHTYTVPRPPACDQSVQGESLRKPQSVYVYETKVVASSPARPVSKRLLFYGRLAYNEEESVHIRPYSGHGKQSRVPERN